MEINSILTQNAVKYTIKHILETIGIKHYNAIKVYELQRMVCLELNNDTRVYFYIMTEEGVTSFKSGSYPVKYISSFDGLIKVPILYGGDKEPITVENTTIRINADILTPAFTLLSRKEEQFTNDRDKYGRFLYDYSISKKYEWIDCPIIDEWAMLLKKIIISINPRIELVDRKPIIKLTHDIDLIQRFGGVLKNIKSIVGGDIVLRKDPVLAIKSIAECIKSRQNCFRDPYYMGLLELLCFSKEMGLQSDFYYMGMNTEDSDYRYDVKCVQAKAFADIAKNNGMRCGIHGSINSAYDMNTYLEEVSRVKAAIGSIENCGRQHYLCFDCLKTPYNWEKAGLAEDYTLGYPDREGFMCGTCIPFRVYDLKNDRPLKVIEHPLIVMEASIRYRIKSRPKTLTKMKELMLRSIAVNGEFVLLWHNSNVGRDWSKWFNEVYKPFVIWALKQMER